MPPTKNKEDKKLSHKYKTLESSNNVVLEQYKELNSQLQEKDDFIKGYCVTRDEANKSIHEAIQVIKKKAEKDKEEIFNDMEFWIVSRIEVNSDEFSDNPLLRSQIQIAFRKFFNYVIKELKQKHNEKKRSNWNIESP